jgi:hypothetical protein
MHDQIQQWVGHLLAHQGYPKTILKRLAVVISGLLDGQDAALASVAESVKGLAITSAEEPSILRRLQRTVSDARLDPERLLPHIFRALLPRLLASVRVAHAANMPLLPSQHARFVAVRLVLDASSKQDQVHLLTLGLAYQGIVLPLAVRAWEQNVPLPEDQYFTEIESMISKVHAELPPRVARPCGLLGRSGLWDPAHARFDARLRLALRVARPKPDHCASAGWAHPTDLGVGAGSGPAVGL